MRVRRVIVFDSDASNPYGPEVADLLSDHHTVAVVMPRDVAVRATRAGCLRPRFQAVTWRDLVTEAAGMWRVLATSDLVVVAWARSGHKCLFLIRSWLRPGLTCLVVHNPRSDRWPSGWRGWLDTALVRRVTPLVHSERLGESLKQLTGARSQIVTHPPYWNWVRDGEVWKKPERRVDEVRVLFFGRFSQDKFSELGELLEELSRRDERIVIRLLLRPTVQLSSETLLGLKLENRSSDGWFPDSELRDSLMWCDVVGAPYTGATDSGSVHLATTLGVPVVAFDVGNLGAHLTTSALAEPGNHVDFVDRLLAAASAAQGTSIHTATVSRALAQSKWVSALGLAACPCKLPTATS